MAQLETDSIDRKMMEESASWKLSQPDGIKPPEGMKPPELYVNQLIFRFMNSWLNSLLLLLFL